MTQETKILQTVKMNAGAALLAVGMVFLGVHSVDTLLRIRNAMEQLATETFGWVLALGLASLHTLQGIVWNHGSSFAILSKFLVSFWPFVFVIVGAALMQKSISGEPMNSSSTNLAGQPFPKGDA